MHHIGRFERHSIRLNHGLMDKFRCEVQDCDHSGGYIALSDIYRFDHELLGVKTITATAQAVLHLEHGSIIPLGRMILDCRGPLYTSTLA